MLACQVVEYNKPYHVHQVPTPSPDGLPPCHLLIKTAVASYCHTDSLIASGVFGTTLPCTASHEGCGTVTATGPSVTRFSVGDRVMCGLLSGPCGICADCRGPENYTQYCGNSKGTMGLSMDGAFAEFVVADERTTAKLPDRVSFLKAAPLACAGCTIFRGLLQADCEKGEWVGIVGAGGGLGHLGVQFAKARGLKVVGVDARDDGLDLARQYGADLVVDARKGMEEIFKEVRAGTGGEGVKASINVSDAGSAPATAAGITRKHGWVVQIAQPPSISFPFQEFIFRDIHVKGSLICSPGEAQEMLDTVAKHSIEVKMHVVRGLDRVPELAQLSHSGKLVGKGVCVIDSSQRNVGL